MNARPWLPALGAVALLCVALWLQHLRHGWPFSLHHGLGPTAAGPPSSPSPAAQPPKAPPRTGISVDPAKLSPMGITTERVALAELTDPIRAVATVVPDERRLSHVHTRVSGWVEKLYVNTTGETVRAGAPLAGVFSQELLASQTEFLSAVKAAQGGPTSAVKDAARTRLKVLGMSDADIDALQRRGIPNRLVTVSAPRSGVVLRRGVTVGTAIDPSTELFTVADLGSVWVVAEIPGSEMANIKVGAEASLEFADSGRPPFPGRVEFVYPTLSEQTRTMRVRFEVLNQDLALKPGAYGTAQFATGRRTVLSVPRDAVVDTGEQQLVFVVTGPGRFEPRTVHLGARLTDRVEVQHGLVEGDQVVASGVFLIDSESRLRASGGAGTGHQHGGDAPQEGPAPSPAQPQESPAHQGHGG